MNIYLVGGAVRDRLLGLLVKDGTLTVDLEDEILKAAVVTHGGAVVHEGVRG